MAEPRQAIETDGFGQSIIDDVRFWWRFSRLRQRPIAWRGPTADEAARIAADPLLGRFGDATIAVAELAGRRGVVRERDWSGWPDPPQFVLFVIGDDKMVWCAKDFDRWPEPWRRVDGAQ